MSITEVFGGNFLHALKRLQCTSLQNFELGKLNYRTHSVVQGLGCSTCTLLVFTVTTQLPGANGYSGGKVVFVDTEVRGSECLVRKLLFSFTEHIVSL